MFSLTYSFPDLEPVCCSMSISNCCFLTCIQICQEAAKVVCYSHLLKNFPQFVVIHTVKGFQIRSVAQSCPTLCDPMNCSTPGRPVHHQLQEFTQTHVHRVSDAIQPLEPWNFNFSKLFLKLFSISGKEVI